MSPSLFPRDLFTGLSMVKISASETKRLERQLNDPEARARMLEQMRDAVKSEMESSDVQTGPLLECDESDRDTAEWICGLDGPSAFVGIYSAEHSRPPDQATVGLSRVHKEMFLVCRAGAGTSASTFHSRLLAGIRADTMATLDSLLESESKVPGPQGLRRLATASSRNRSRIIADVALAIKLAIPTIGDAASRNKYRGAVLDVDVAVNTLRKLDGDECAQSTWQLTTGVDACVSKGLVTLSNAAEGIVFFINKSGEHKTTLRNECWSSIPFVTQRLFTGRTISDVVTSAYKQQQQRHANSSSHSPHIDSEWIRSRFTWKNREYEQGSIVNAERAEEVEPFALWGSHTPEGFVQSFARELGLADLNAIKLRPEAVVIAGVESGKLRSILKSI